MRARPIAALFAVPLLALSLVGCDAALLMGPTPVGGGSGIPSGGSTIVTGGGLAITRFDSDPSRVQTEPGETRRLSVEANRTGTAFTWSASGGTLSSYTGASSTWTAPTTPGNYRVDVTARNGSDEAKASFQFTVVKQ